MSEAEELELLELEAEAEASQPAQAAPKTIMQKVGGALKTGATKALNIVDKVSHFGQPQAAKDLVQRIATDPKSAPNPEAASQVANLPPWWQAMGSVMPGQAIPTMPPGVDIRPAASMIADMATSPSTYLSGGLSALSKIPAVATAMNVIGRAPKALNRFAGRLAEEASGVPEEALRAHGTPAGRAAILQNAGKEFEIGQDIVSRIENFDDYLPEKEAVNKILEMMPGISPENALKALRQSKSATTLAPGKPMITETVAKVEQPTAANLVPEDGPARNRAFDVLTGDRETKVIQAGEAGRPTSVIPVGDVANKKIDDLMSRLKLVAGEDMHTGQTGKIPAKQFREIRSGYYSLDKVAFNIYDLELVERALVSARTAMADDLRQAARSMGDEEYAAIMETYSGKLDKLERVKKFLGASADTRESRAEGFVSNLLNINKTSQQNLMRDLEDIFDADFMTRIQGAKWAKQIGKDGNLAVLPMQVTGRANLAQTLMGTLGMPFSSPWLAARATLPAADALANAHLPPWIKASMKQSPAVSAVGSYPQRDQ